MRGFPGMKQLKNNKNLLDKRKFEKADEEKRQWLKNLSWNKALQLEESLISSELIWEWRKNFSKDNPICLKDGLRGKT